MTVLDECGRAFECGFAHNQELRFLAERGSSPAGRPAGLAALPADDLRRAGAAERLERIASVLALATAEPDAKLHGRSLVA